MANHPYYPTSTKLPGYSPMVVDFIYVLGIFTIACAASSIGTWMFSAKYKKNMTKADRILASWFMTTGLIHFVIEGYVVAVADFYKDTTGSYLSETWKEYSKADSRYATRDSFIISMEAITAFVWGPLCPVLVYGLLTKKAWRYTLMIIISLGQIYGDVLYYGTCYLEGFVHSRPEAMYFWGYFVFVNSIWIVIPGLAMLYAASRINKAVGPVKRATTRKTK